MDDENSGVDNKVIFLGEAGVGKTTLIKVSLGEQYKKEYISSLSLSFNQKEITYNKKKYIFNLWDTIGQEKYRSLTKIFYKKSKVVIFVYDITNLSSFKNLEYWVNSVNDVLGNENYIKAIIGNKSDLYLNEQVKEQEAKDFAASNGAKFKLCTAKNDPLSFIKFLDELCIETLGGGGGNKETQKQNDNKPNAIKLDKKDINNKKGKCAC